MPTSPARKTAATRSGNPAKRAAAKPAGAVSSASSFKKRQAAEPYDLPSGEVARIKRIELTTLLAEGLLSDDLTAIAQKAVEAGKGMDVTDQDDFARDPKKVAAALDSFDRVTVRTWVEPSVVYYRAIWSEAQQRYVMPGPDEDAPVIPESDRDDELLYSDEIEMADKIYTLNLVSGGNPDLATFREQFGQSLAQLSAG